MGLTIIILMRNAYYIQIQSSFYIILLSFALILSMPIMLIQFNNFIKPPNPYSLLSSSFPSYDAFGQYSIAPTAPGGPSYLIPI